MISNAGVVASFWWGEATDEPAREDARPTGFPELDRLISGAKQAHALGLKVNAGHGLNYQNTPGILAVPHLETLNTGHSIIARALFVGLRQAVGEMLALMRPCTK